MIWATRDLGASASRLLGRTGLVSVAGGRHLGLGTENRIVPLGSAYLELLTVVDREEAASSTFGGWALDTLASRDEGWMGWSVVVDDVGPQAARLGIEIGTLERGGLVVDHAGMKEARCRPCLPFFLARRAGVADPARIRGACDSRPCGPISLELRGSAFELEQWLGGDLVDNGDVEVSGGEPSALLAVSIAVERRQGIEEISLAPR
ncbi:MAG: VOC family protein [Actinobacteria bacterium]|nr:VOC family protein [Actinomycetota bacterium]